MSVTKKPSRSLAGIAGIVAVATLISKLFGLVREVAIAAAFGVGPVVNAFSYANLIPNFFFILLGGINGPFHSALVSVLSKRDKSQAATIVETVSTLVSGILLLLTVILIWKASIFIDIVGINLNPEQRSIATLQLRIMAPLALLSGLIGIGFGTLNASEQYWLPSISPLFSSLAIIGSVSLLFWQLGEQINAPQYIQLGAIFLAAGTLLGAILQWLAQVIAQWRSGMGKLRLRFDWRLPGVQEVLQVMIPATFASGMLHINLSTDLIFVSGIATAAAAIRYANFIVITPIGIISNVIFVSMLPVFSRLAAPENWQELKMRIRQGLILTALTMLPLTAIFISLAVPIVRVIYDRGVFKEAGVEAVAPVLMAYGLGMFFYLGRDLLVRVFYALGDGNTPFRISIANILLNIVLDYFLVNAFATPGIVFATIGVNITSMILMLWILNRRLNGLPLKKWGLAILGLTGASLVAGLGSWSVNWSWEQFLGSSNLWLQLLQLGISILVALIIFASLTALLKLPEVDILISRIKKKFAG
ncbi:MAG: murein biosynthesis integral membrane protein MurJ [Prochloraceae cyanobacterium]